MTIFRCFEFLDIFPIIVREDICRSLKTSNWSKFSKWNQWISINKLSMDRKVQTCSHTQRPQGQQIFQKAKFHWKLTYFTSSKH